VTAVLLADAASAGWSWNPVTDLAQMWAYPFMVSAFRAGAVVAVVSAAVGWFVVLRRQTFAGHTLSAVAFPGAAGATLIGVGAVYGYFAVCLAAAVVIALFRRHGGDREESAGIGIVQAFLPPPPGRSPPGRWPACCSPCCSRSRRPGSASSPPTTRPIRWGSS
jgi:zinc/manganese transport system permease protein